MKRILLITLGLSTLMWAPPPNPDFTRSNNIVTDLRTELQWQDDAAAKTEDLDWKSAIEHCEALDLDGIGWRLPNIRELGSLVDNTELDPSISTSFQNVESSYYWSSTTYGLNNGESAWQVNFFYGYQDFGNDKSSSAYVRCVRTVQ